jgi:D-ribose pyranose/furanose isomerase RbsD
MGITLYNDTVSVIESYDESKIKEIDLRLTSQQNRIIEIMERAIVTQEKASDALALAREVAAESRGNQREVEATLSSIRSEVDANLEGIRAEMKALRKSTTNPLGN